MSNMDATTTGADAAATAADEAPSMERAEDVEYIAGGLRTRISNWAAN